MTFEDYARERGPTLLRLATVLCGDPFAAEDIVQDVFTRAYQRWDRISAVEYPHSYVRRMIVNEFLSSRRRRRWTEPLALEHGSEHPDATEAHADRAELLQLIERLPSRQRAVIVLRYYEGLDDSEIAELMGCACSTVRSNMARALSALRIDAQSHDSHRLCKDYT